LARGPALFKDARLTPEGVGDVAQATQRLYEFIVQSPRHGPFIRAVDNSPRRPRAVAPGTVVAIAPAALYKEYRRSGADGRRVREVGEKLGLTVETIPLEPMGALEVNASILLQWLQDCAYDNIVIVSLSKGSSDVKKALVMEGAFDAFSKVSVWISVGGLLEGTPLARWLLSNERFPTAFRALNRIRGVNFRFLEEVDRRPDGPLDFDFSLPAHVRLLHLLGFPLPEHATNWLARLLYRRLAQLGPNDGFMLLTDAVEWPGLIYPVWGADHYFRTHEDPRPLLEKVLCLAVEPGSLAVQFG
jgi:hypothetical protein